MADVPRLVLLLVAFHPPAAEVQRLQACLDALSAEVAYAVVVNDHQPGEAVDALASGALLYLPQAENPGYGRAVNRLVKHLAALPGGLPPYLGVLNTDLCWELGSFERMLAWLDGQPDVVLAVPRLVDPEGCTQKLCKRNPTVLGLLSRRFVPSWLKPAWLKRYDRWYVMASQNYDSVFEASYLSGCCMLMRSQAFERCGGFDEAYFLYLEDADLTRRMQLQGRCVHYPDVAVMHVWGRGNYRSLYLMAVNLISAWIYFRRWGWQLW